MTADSESLFQILGKYSATTEKRLMIEIRAEIEASEKREVTDITWIRSKYDINDGVTKVSTFTNR